MAIFQLQARTKITNKLKEIRNLLNYKQKLFIYLLLCSINSLKFDLIIRVLGLYRGNNKYIQIKNIFNKLIIIFQKQVI